MELNKELIDCMSKLRRSLRDELALDIRLSQTDAIEALYSGSQRSSNSEIRQLGQRLAVLAEIQVATPPSASVKTIEHIPIPSSAPTAFKVYRGQRIYS